MAPLSSPLRPLLALVIALLLLTLTPTALWAQGASREDRNAVNQTADKFVQIPRASQLPPIVDLRPYLPPVGLQTMNDCAAWAYGYAGRTYLEAVDQAWKPDKPERIFSPTFIYNQVNKGKDAGSNPLEVLKLLRDQGAATLSTQPYLAKDFTTSPKPLAVQEAKEFRIAGYSGLPDGQAMRIALAQGNIVLVGVRTNPVFSSGRYDIYTSDLHDTGQKQRAPDQPHGFHAMVVCGYSEHKKAFLFMNSWGKTWGQSGYVWVSYDVADKFNLGESTQQLVDYAILMRDRREPVVRENGRYKAVELKEMQIVATPRFTGLNKDGQARYDVLLELTGPSALQQRFTKVQWAYIEPTGQIDVDKPTDASQNYAMAITTSQQTFKALAIVQTKDGQSVIYSRQVLLPKAVDRQVSLLREDSFFTLSKDKKPHVPLWRWSLVPQLSEQDWADLDTIQWTIKSDPQEAAMRAILAKHPRQLTPLPATEKFTFTSQTPGAPSQAIQTLAYPSGISDKPPQGEAVFKFRDGTVFTLPLPADPLPLLGVDENIRIQSTVRSVGVFAGQEWFFYEVRALYPEVWDTLWDDSYFSLYGQGQGWLVVPGQRTRGLSPAATFITGHAVHTFDASVYINLLRGAPGNAFFRPPSVPVDQLLAGAQGADTQYLHERQVPIDGQAFKIRHSDRYIGIRDGKPHWLFDAWVDGYETGGRPDQGTWTLPGKQIKLDVYGKKGAPKLGVTYEASAPFTAKLATSRAVPDGNDSKTIQLDLSADIQPRSPQNDAITLFAYQGLDGNIGQLKGQQPGDMVFTRFVGPLDRLRTIARVDYLIPLMGAARLPVPVYADQLLAYADGLSGARLPHPGKDNTVDAILYFTDGSTMVKRALPTPQTPYPILPQLQLEATSRYHGIVAGRPTWRVTATFTGQQSRLAQLQSINFSCETSDAGKLTPQPGQSALSCTLLTSQPLFIRADVTFKDAQSEPQSFTTIAVTPADTIIDKPRLVRMVRSIKQSVMDPNAVEIWKDYESGETYSTFLIQASELDLARIDKVTYKLTDPALVEAAKTDPEAKPVTLTPVTTRADTWFDGFPFLFTEWDEGSDRMIDAQLHFKDGKTLDTNTLTTPSHIDADALFPRVVLEEIPYGVNPQTNRPQRLLTVRCDGAPHLTREILRLDYTLDRDTVKIGKPAGASFTWPGHFAQFIIEQPTSLKSVQTARWAKSEWEIAQENKDLQAPAFADRPDFPNPTGLTVDALPGESAPFNITPNLPLSAFQNVHRVHYQVTQNGQTRTVTPISLYGYPAQRFACTVAGPKPTSVVMIATAPDGKQSQLATWPSP